MNEKDSRHILALSGGKDSAALAVYMKDRVPNMEYVFCDTGKELQETYDYLGLLEVYGAGGRDANVFSGKTISAGGWRRVARRV